MKQSVMLAAAAVLAAGAMGSAKASPAYVYETGTGDPWGSTSNDAAMNTAFGAGNWTKYQGFSLAGFTNTKFVFLDGSDEQSGELAAFLAGNLTAIQNYVSAGGHVFINDAPNDGSQTIDFGFGGVAMEWNNYATASTNVTVTAAGIAAGLTAGGIGTAYSGGYFNHSTIAGPISDLVDNGSGDVVFGARSWGAGLAAFGGQTTSNFHSPQPAATRLLENELTFAANGAQIVAAPEPAGLSLLGAGVVAIGILRRRRGGKSRGDQWVKPLS